MTQKIIQILQIREIHQSFKSVIQTKGHAGEIKVKSKEGEGSTFIIQLPNVKITDFND